jgi:type IX secretion system PorP/SprF family membrane protein
MIIRKFTLTLLCIGVFISIKAQDLHYTLYDLAPVKLNPAHTGSFYGTVRVGGIFRDQWFTIIDDEYRTPSFFFDSPVIRGFREQDWVGGGLQFVNDRAGTGNLRTSGMLLSASYHFSLDKKQTKILTLGVQGGSMSRKLDVGMFSAGDLLQSQLDGTAGGQSTDPLLNTSGGQQGGSGGRNEGDLNTNYLDINAGLLFHAKDEKKGTDLTLGLAVRHINRGNESFGGTGGGGGIGNPNPNPGIDTPEDSKRPLGLILHGRYEYPVNDTWSAEPSFLFQTIGGGKNNIILQGWAGYQFNDQIKLRGGLGYRVGDSAQILLGAVVDESLQVGISYDLNISQLSGVSSYQGGFEIGANYIIKIYKQPEIKQAILCPKL